MTDKELRRLRRSDLLEIMVAQSKEVTAVKEQQEILERHIEQQEADYTRLIAKLDDKDVQMEHLKEKLTLKDEQIEHLKEKLTDKDEQLERLKGKLDEKDALIEKLKGRLDEKDATIEQLKKALGSKIDDQMKKLDKSGSKNKNSILSAVQDAANIYLGTSVGQESSKKKG